MHTVTQTIHQVELKDREWNSPRGSPTPKHRRPSPVHGSPAPKHYGPSPAQWGPMADHETMSIEAQGHLPDNFHDASLYQIHRRWTAPQGSPTPKHRRPKPVHSGYMGHPKLTPMEPEGRVPDSFLDGTSSAFVYRRWKSPRGSPSHKPTKSHHESSSTFSATRASSPTCIHGTPGLTVDPSGPAHNESGTLFRNSCGETKATVAECPWLCYIQGGVQVCSNYNATEPLGQRIFICHQCLPPCDQPSSSSLSTTCTITSSVLSLPSATGASSSACISVAPGITVDPEGPAQSGPASDGTLFRFDCGVTKATVAECPWLCFNGGAAKVCVDHNITGPGPAGLYPYICQHCLPPCDQTLNCFLPTKDSFLPTRGTNTTSLAHSPLPSTSSFLPIKDKVLSTGTTTTSLAHSTLPPTSSFLPTKDNLLSIGTTTTSLPPPTLRPTCTALDPFVGTMPSTKDNATGALLRFECGLSFRLAYECPYLCGYGVGENLGECYDHDNSVSVPKKKDIEYKCTHCFYPSRKVAASSASDKSNCTAIDPYNPPCPPSVRFDDGIRYQTACAAKAIEIKDCPYLCTAVDKADHYHCENENLDGAIFKPTGTTQVCVQCLPEC